MPKQIYQLKDFSGGLNNLRDATDIADNEVAEAKNVSFAQQGAVGGAYNMTHASNNLVTTYNTDHIDHLEGGYGLGYFETDHYAADGLTRSIDLTGNVTPTRGFVFYFDDPRIYIYALNDGSVKNDPSDSGTAAAGSTVELNLWFPVGTEIKVSGSTQGTGGTAFTAGTLDGIYTVIGVEASENRITIDRRPNAMINVAQGGGGFGSILSSVTAIITGIPSGDKVLLLAHPDEHKIDVYSTSRDIDSTGWILDAITLQNWADDDTRSQVLYYKTEEAIRCCDTNRNTSGRIQWYGWISRQHFSYPGNANTNEYSGYYAKDNNLASPTFGNMENSSTNVAYPTAGKGFNLKCVSHASDTGLIESKLYEFGQTFIYDNNQESLVSHYSKLDNSPASTLNSADALLNATDLKQLNIQIGAKGPYDPRISGGRIYIREHGSDEEWIFLLDIDLTKGARVSLGGDYTEWKAASTTEYFIGATITTFMIVDSLSLLTYEAINGYPASIFSNDIGGVGENWKDVVVSNNRAFVCNVRIKDKNKGQHKLENIAGEADITEFKDRIMYSMPNRFDTFPEFNFIEASKGDSDHYMAIQAYADRLLAFKRNSLDIINISSPSDSNWFLEETKNYMGVEHHVAVSKTQYGIVWVNKNGLFLYDGQTIKDLTENKIDDNLWYEYVTLSSGIIYDEVKSMIFVIKGFSSGNGDAYMCDLKKGNFSYLTNFTFDNITNSVDTNFSNVPNTSVGTILSSNTKLHKFYRNHQAVTYVDFQTKNYTLGDPNILKKVYAVYITYQAASSIANDVFYSMNGGVGWTATAAGPSTITSGTPGWTKGKWVITDSPTTSTIMIKIYTGSTSNLVKINDIGIEYRPIHKRMA